MTIGCEMTDKSRSSITLVNGGTKASGEHTIGAYKANQANSQATCFQSYSPQSGHEYMDGENLVEMCIIRSWKQRHMEMRPTRATMALPSTPT